MVTDRIADLLTRIRNAQMAGKKYVRVPASVMSKRVLDVLLREGFLSSVEDAKSESKFGQIDVGLKYYPDGRPFIGMARRMSRPGRRAYSRTGDLPKVQCGLGMALISTSQGVMSDNEARKKKIGGEVLALIG